MPGKHKWRGEESVQKKMLSPFVPDEMATWLHMILDMGYTSGLGEDEPLGSQLSWARALAQVQRRPEATAGQTHE